MSNDMLFFKWLVLMQEAFAKEAIDAPVIVNAEVDILDVMDAT